MRCLWTQPRRIDIVWHCIVGSWSCLKVEKVGASKRWKRWELPKDLAASAKRRNQIRRAVLPKRWRRSYTRHHPCHKVQRSQSVLLALAKSSEPHSSHSTGKTVQIISSNPFPQYHHSILIQGHWCHWCKYTLPAMAPAVGCSQANSSCSEPRSGVGMVYNNMILDTILFTQLDNM